MVELADGATSSNVTLGGPAAEGVHCQGSCRLYGIVWEDVATFRGRNATVVVDGGIGEQRLPQEFQDNRESGGFLTLKEFLRERLRYVSSLLWKL